MLPFIVCVVAEVDIVGASVRLIRLTVLSGQAVMGEIIIDIAVAHIVVVLLEAECKGLRVAAGRWHTLPIEVIVVGLVVVAVVELIFGQFHACFIGGDKCFAQVDVGIVRNTQVNTVHHELESGLRGVEATEVGGLGAGGPGLTVGVRDGCGVPIACRAIDLHLVRIAHEVPFQVLRHGLHAVGSGLVLAIVVGSRVVIDESTAVPFQLLSHSLIQRSHLVLEGGQLIEVSMVTAAVCRGHGL